MSRGVQSSRLRFAMILLLALVLQIIPSFTDLALWRPSFILLVFVYFLIYEPHRYGVGTAWLAGLLMDVVYGGVLGRYALALGLCAYLLQLMRKRLLHAKIWYQCALVFLLVCSFQLFSLSVTMLVAKPFSWQLLLFPALSSTVIWPILYLLLRRISPPVIF